MGGVRAGVNRGGGSIIAYFKLFLHCVKYKCVDGLDCGVNILLKYSLVPTLYNSEVIECVREWEKVDVMIKISAAFLYKYK